MSSNKSNKSNKLVDPELYGTQLGRVRAMAKLMLTDSSGTIDEESAIRVVQVALHSLKHPDYEVQGTRLIKNLIDPSAPSKKEFDGIEDLIEKMSSKIITKHIFDQTKS